MSHSYISRLNPYELHKHLINEYILTNPGKSYYSIIENVFFAQWSRNIFSGFAPKNSLYFLLFFRSFRALSSTTEPISMKSSDNCSLTCLLSSKNN